MIKHVHLSETSPLETGLNKFGTSGQW